MLRSADGSGTSLLRELVVCALAVAAVVGCAFLAIGVPAAIAQDGISESMRQALGPAAPAPLQLFRSVLALAVRFWPWALAAVAAHVILRFLLRRRLAFGDSLEWDALVSPFVTALLSGVVVALVEARRHGLSANAVVQNGLLVSIATFLALALAGLAAALLTRHRGLRVAVAGVVLLAGVARLGAEAWGRSALASFQSQHAAEWTANEARRAARVRPALQQPAIDEDAWPRYLKLIDAARGSDLLKSLAGAGDLRPFESTPPAAKAALDAHRQALAAFDEATRCRRSLPELPKDPVSPMPSLLGVRLIADLAVLDGNEKVQSGDLAGGAKRYLQVVRMGGDVADGQVIHAMLGAAVEYRGLRALGRLVHSGRLDEGLLASIERDRALLESSRVSFAQGLENSRRAFGGLGLAVDRWPALAEEPLVLPLVVPYRAFAAQAQRAADRLTAGLQDAMARDDFDAWRQASARVKAEAGSSRNPMLRMVMGVSGSSDGTYGDRFFVESRRPLVYFRLVDASIRIEQARHKAGRYLADATGLSLPADPFASGQALRYRLDGALYRVWSVGYDGIDGGGNAERDADMVL